MQDYLADLTSAATVTEGQSLSQQALTQIFDSALSILPGFRGASDEDTHGGAGGEADSTEESVADTATAALLLTSSVLAAATTIDTQTATSAAEVLDYVLGSEMAVSSAGAGDQVASSIAAIGDAVLLGAASHANNSAVIAVTISTTNLNITAEKRSPAEVAQTPSMCKTETEPAIVELPPDVLSALSGGGQAANASEPIEFLFFSSAVNLHGPPPIVPRGQGAISTGVAAVSPASMASPLISFSLRQGGKELKVNGTASPIAITVPLRKGTNTTNRCIGQPANASAAGCQMAFECRYWDEASSEWRGDGCRTMGSEGKVLCECNHLTDFVVL